MVERGWVSGVGGVRLRYYDFGGTGRPILLLHGLFGRTSFWRDLPTWLTQYGRVVGFDQRGHGQSDKPAGPYDRTAYVGDAIAVIESLGLSPVTVLGFSMGAGTTFSLAARRPELVAAAILEDMYHKASERENDMPQFEGWVRSFPVPFPSIWAAQRHFDEPGPYGTHDYFVESLVESESGWEMLWDPQHIIDTRRDWWTNSYSHELRAVSCPTLVVRGADGDPRLFPREDFVEMVELLQDGRLVDIPNADHLVHERNPEAFKEAVAAFLTSLA